MMFVLPGLTSHSQTPYVINMAKDAYKRGYDVCVINYRGLAGAKLVTPKLYTVMSYLDVEEPIKYVIGKYGKDNIGNKS